MVLKNQQNHFKFTFRKEGFMNLISCRTSVQVVVIMASAILLSFEMPVKAGSNEDSVSVLTSVSYASVHAFNCLGRNVKFTGTVKRILESGMPLEVLMTTGGYRWIAQFYNTDSISDRVIAPHNRVVIEGMLLTIDDRTMIGGTSQGLIVVMAKRVYLAKKRK